jgi:type IV pilus assembly protein PilP
MRAADAAVFGLFLATAAAMAAPPPKTPTPVAKPAAPAAPAESPGQAILEQDEAAMAGLSYSYDPAGRRDPFRSLLVRGKESPGQRPPGIPGIAIDDVTLQGIWRTRAGYVAQIRGTDNKSHLLRAGDQLFDGEVLRIGPNEVVFRQNVNDPQSVKPFRDLTKQLNATIRP